MPQIGNLLITHINECLEISNNLLGKNYHDSLYFEKAAKNKQGLVVIDDKKVIGFLVYQITAPENSFKMYGVFLDENVGHIGSVCVKKSYQNKGFATQLIAKAAKDLKNQISTIYTLAWEYNGKVNLKKALKKNNFIELNMLKKPWENQCNNNEFNCPVKESRCICSGIVYKLEIS